MKLFNREIFFSFLLVLSVASPLVIADDLLNKRSSIEKLEKDIAKDKNKLTNKRSEITTHLMKLEKDVNRYGNDSNQARSDRKHVENLRNDYADLKSQLYKDSWRKEVLQGKAVEEST